MFSSALHKIVVPLAFRMNLLDLFIIPCRLPACADFTRPDAVNLNRFLAPDFVFILGILFSTQCFQRVYRDILISIQAFLYIFLKNHQSFHLKTQPLIYLLIQVY